MSSQPTTSSPQPSALPPSMDTPDTPPPASSAPLASSIKPQVTPPRTPLLRLEIRDLSSTGTRSFLRLIHASTALENAVSLVLTHLYTGLSPSKSIPPTRSVTLVLEAMSGVAYTTGLDLDADHKEIHFSTSYIAGVADARRKEEIEGVLVHEMVHCWQHDALGTAPGGLIEGIADWVRLKSGFAPPHWRRRADCEWDAGYEKTGFFLEWLEGRYGAGIVRRINEGLRGCEYDAEGLWHGCCGRGVEELWEEYKESLGEEGKEGEVQDDSKVNGNVQPGKEKE